uniref:F-box domain-containing protein n=1 Tax=Parascaris equorum TaxID=6256 RepID=A0A914RU36_PAREQ
MHSQGFFSICCEPAMSSCSDATTIEKLPDKVLQEIFSYLSPYQVLLVGQVCRRWKSIANSPSLWQYVSFRPNYGGIQVESLDHIITRLCIYESLPLKPLAVLNYIC